MNKGIAVLLAKIETTYGTDPTPAAADDSILAFNFDFEPAGSRRNRQAILPWFGEKPGVNEGEALKLKFSCELKGGGDGVEPRIGRLLEACNMTQSGGYVYTVNSLSSTAKSLTFYYYVDGVLHKVHGARGTFKMSLKSKEIAMVDFEFTGLYSADHDSAASVVTPVFQGIDPLIVKGIGFTHNSVSTYVVDGVEIDLGNEMVMRKSANDSTGISEHYIKNRIVKGSYEPEMLTTRPHLTLWENSTAADISFTLNGGTGNTVAIALNDCVVDIPTYGERDGALTQKIGFQAHPSTSGNDELIITFS